MREWAIDREEIQQQDSKEASKRLHPETISHRFLMKILNKAKRSILEQPNPYIKKYSRKTIVQVTIVNMSLTIEGIETMRTGETMASSLTHLISKKELSINNIKDQIAKIQRGGSLRRTELR